MEPLPAKNPKDYAKALRAANEEAQALIHRLFLSSESTQVTPESLKADLDKLPQLTQLQFNQLRNKTKITAKQLDALIAKMQQDQLVVSNEVSTALFKVYVTLLDQNQQKVSLSDVPHIAFYFSENIPAAFLESILPNGWPFGAQTKLQLMIRYSFGQFLERKDIQKVREILFKSENSLINYDLKEKCVMEMLKAPDFLPPEEKIQLFKEVLEKSPWPTSAYIISAILESNEKNLISDELIDQYVLQRIRNNIPHALTSSAFPRFSSFNNNLYNKIMEEVVDLLNDETVDVSERKSIFLQVYLPYLKWNKPESV